MKPISLPPLAEREKLLETPTEVLVELILRQPQRIEQLVAEVKRLKSNASSDSRSSSKPPSSDIHKPSEQHQPEAEASYALMRIQLAPPSLNPNF